MHDNKNDDEDETKLANVNAISNNMRNFPAYLSSPYLFVEPI